VLRLAWTLSASLAQDPAPAVLRWEAPPDCPGAAEVMAVLAVYRAGQPVRPGVHARAIVTTTEQGYALALTIDAPEGATEMTLADPGCGVLVDATALVVALHLDATRVPAPRAVPVQRSPAPRRVVTGSVRGFAGGATGLGPAVAGVLGVAVGMTRRRVRGELALIEGLTRTQPSVPDPAAGVAVRGWAGQVRVCYAPQVGRWQLLLCGDGEFGAQVATGVGVAAQRTRRAPWASVGGAAGLTGWISPNIGVWLEGRGHAALTRPQFGLDGLGVVYRAPAGGVRVLVGLEVRFAVISRGRGGD